MSSTIVDLLEDEGVPNFDAMSASELIIFADATAKHIEEEDRRETADVLFPDQDDEERKLEVLHELHVYASNASMARRYRMSGHIDQALRFEARCDSVYDGLPTWARW